MLKMNGLYIEGILRNAWMQEGIYAGIEVQYALCYEADGMQARIATMSPDPASLFSLRVFAKQENPDAHIWVQERNGLILKSNLEKIDITAGWR